MPNRDPGEFRRKVLDLEAGRPVAQVAADLNISDQTTDRWRRLALIDTGQAPGITPGGQTETTAARNSGRNRRAGPRAAEIAAPRDHAQSDSRPCVNHCRGRTPCS